MNCCKNYLTILFIFTLKATYLFDVYGDYNPLLYRSEARDVFLHAFDSYMKFGYPHDEVMPISCEARRYDHRTRGTLDDTMGGYMLTLVDSLDTLIVFREFDRFKLALDKISTLSFATDVNISVFEANIRVIGGLLSAHQLALHVFDHTVYDGFSLLSFAINLGTRLLPAFQTKTGIPVHRINLKSGTIKDEQVFTCTAAGTSYLLEMGLLSRLSGNPVFEKVAHTALKSLWEKRSKLNLVGSLIDTHTGKWVGVHTGIGAGIDSFYETMIKSAILLGEPTLMGWFEEAYDAIQAQTNFDVCISTLLATQSIAPRNRWYRERIIIQ